MRFICESIALHALKLSILLTAMTTAAHAAANVNLCDLNTTGPVDSSVGATTVNTSASLPDDNELFSQDTDWNQIYDSFLKGIPKQKLPFNTRPMQQQLADRLKVLSSEKNDVIELFKFDVQDFIKRLESPLKQNQLFRLIDESAAIITFDNVRFYEPEYVNHVYVGRNAMGFQSDLSTFALSNSQGQVKRILGESDSKKVMLLPTTRDLTELDFVRLFHVPVYPYGVSLKVISEADGRPYTMSGFLGHDGFHTGTTINTHHYYGYNPTDPVLIAARRSWYPQIVRAIERIEDRALRHNLIKIIFEVVHEQYHPIEYIFHPESWEPVAMKWRLQSAEGYNSIVELDALGRDNAKALHERSIAWIRAYLAANPGAQATIEATIAQRGYKW